MKLSRRQLDALRFLAVIPDEYHKWRSIHAGIMVQSPDDHNAHGRDTVQSLVMLGLAREGGELWSYGITHEGLRVLAELETECKGEHR